MNSRTMVILAMNVCALLALLYVAGVIPPVAGRTSEPMLLIAHRGDMAHHPENTIEAIVAAAELGADGVEMDAWRSRSGTWWVMHDPTVNRTTDGSGLISELSDADMATLTIDGGVGFDPAHQGIIRPPTLNDALMALLPYRCEIYVHLKDPSPSSARDLAVELAQSHGDSAITVIVPSPDSAETIQAAAGGLRTIVLQDGIGMPEDSEYVDGWLTSARRVIRPDIVALRTYPVEVYASAVRGTWDEAADLLRANRFNVRAFITNDVGRAQRVLASAD